MLLILLSISLCFSRVSPETNVHTGIYTIVSGMKEFPEVTSTATVNGVIIASCDSKTQQCIPRQQFLADFFDMNFWNYVTELVNRHANMAKKILSTIMKRTNQTSGVHIFQRITTVEVSDDGSIKRSMRFGFDGEDFISLDPDRMRWIAPNPIAVMTKKKWDSDDSWNNYWKRHLEEVYVEYLNTYLEAGKDYFKRKVQPEVFISRREPNGQDKPLTLSCLVTGFYPVDIEVTWLRNGEVMSETQSSGVRPNHDGTHQIQKEIEINAGDEDQYSCHIDHSSLAEAQLYQWEIPENSVGYLHLGILTGSTISALSVLVGIIGILIWKQPWRAQPFLETRPTLRQQEVMDKNVELKLMSKSEPQLKTQPLQRESNYPRGLEEGNKATNEEESPSETDKLNPASNVSDGNTVKYHPGSNVTEFVTTSEEQEAMQSLLEQHNAH